MSSGQPSPRWRHAAVGIGQRLYIWGGDGSSRVDSKTLHILDVSSVTWEEPQRLSGSLPGGMYGMAVTTHEESAYSFGGNTGSYCDTIYQVNLAQSTLRKLIPANSGSSNAPKAKCYSGMVHFNHKLVVYGGYGDQGRTDELYVFDLREKVWTDQPTTGSKPPPLTWHTFTKIDHHRAVVFGGDMLSSINDTYVLDMETWHWTKLNITGDKPLARYDHATCCIAGPLTGQQHPLLLVVAGYASSVRTARDVWLLDVDKGVWSQISLPVAITPRCGHSAVVFGSGPDFRVVVLFGGLNGGSYLSDTTLLLLELRGGSWQVTRVVKPRELRRPDKRLREQMRKLELSPQEGTVNDVEQSLRKEQERRAEAERQVQLLEQRLAKLQTQTILTDGAASPTAYRDTSSPTHTRERRADTGESTTADTAAITKDAAHTGEMQLEAEDTDSSAAATAHSNSKSTVVTINLSDLDIGKKKLGSGKFGNVYEGYWKKGGGMTVAAKVTQSDDSATLPQEIQVWHSVPPHQNIVTLIGVASVQFLTYIVTELARNGSLYDYLHSKRQKPSVSQSLTWALDVAHGMMHLHNHDVIHRDLKSANVLLTSGWVAKLCDFGSARELTRTVTTEHTGTYRWMAPEIMRTGTARINKKCDLFSYGMILFELFTHEIPYADSRDNIEVLLSVTSGQRPPIPLTLPPYLHDLLRSCWEEDPHLRPSFDDFVHKIVVPKSK